MDDASPSTEGSETQLSSDHSDEADDEWRLQLEKAIADDFSSYDCFMQPFYSLDEKDKNKKELDGVDEKQTDTVDACLQNNLGEKSKETVSNKTDSMLEINVDGRIKAYQYDILRLKRMVAEKVKDVKDITAEKEELESNLQSTLHKLWIKEEELHTTRENSIEREKSLVDCLRQESANSVELENEVKSLTNQNDALKEQVFQLGQQLLDVKEETEKRRQELEQKLSELENTQESPKNMTVGLVGQIVDVMSGQNKQASRSVDVSSTTSVEETSSELSCCEKYSESPRESTEADLIAVAEATHLKEQTHILQNELKTLESGIEDVLQKINLGSEMHTKERIILRKDPKRLLSDIYQAYCQEKSKVVHLEEQNNRQLKHLQEVEEALCSTGGRIQRIWVNISLYEERDEEMKEAWRNGTHCIEETEGVLQKIESVLSRNKVTFDENQELKLLNASQEKKITDLQGLVAKARKEEREISKQLEIRNAKIDELKLSTKKLIEDKDLEIEILKEQLQQNEMNEEQLKPGNCVATTDNKCTDKILEKLLQNKERDFEGHKRKYEKEELALREEIRDLTEALERTKSDKNDLDEYCKMLKESLENTEALLNSLEEEEKTLRESLEEAKKKETKLYLVARELYDELQTKTQENFFEETTIAALCEKTKCLEMEIQTVEQERQVDKKNLKNAKETEQYLRSSLQHALADLFELKGKLEEIPEENTHQVQSEQQDDQQETLLERLHELDSIIHSAVEKSVRDLEEYALRIGELCEENDSLKKEVNEYKNTSTTLQRTNHRLKTLLQAMKNDLLEEMKAKKELGVLLVKSNHKTEPVSPEYNKGSDEQSTSSQLPEIKQKGINSDPLGSSSDYSLQGEKKTGKLKGISKLKVIPKTISKHLSSSSLGVTSPRKQKKTEPMPGTTQPQTSTKITENDRSTDKLEKPKTEEHEQRLRNILMTVQCDKEQLELKVESMSEELQRTKARLQNYERLNESIRDEADRNVKEMAEMKKVLEVICERTEGAYYLINKDILDLSEVSKSNEEQVRKLEQILGQYERENTELQRQVETLKKKVEDEVTVKEAALEEGRQLRVSMKTVLESKEKCLSLSEPPLLIKNLNTDITLPQMRKEEVRAILKEILQDIEYSCSEEVTRLKQRLAEQTEELKMIRKDNDSLQNLVDAGLHEELQKAERTIAHLTEQLKVSQEKQNALQEAAMKDKLKANEDTERLYERFAELKITIKSKDEALERYQELEEVLMIENTQLQEEIESFKERFGSNGLLPLTEKAETKRVLETWKRKCQRLEENFEKENNHLKEENVWLHKQLAEESLACAELRQCKARLEDSLEKAEEKLKTLHRKLEERQQAVAGFEERRVSLETKLLCLQKVNDDLQNELSKERFEADRNLMEVRNEFEATAKDLKRHQREGNNLVTKVFLLENAKEKLEQEVSEKERKMTISLESFTEERSRLSEKLRALRISLEEEVKRRLDLEEKMQQIVTISVAEKEQSRLNAIKDSLSSGQNVQRADLKTYRNSRLQKALEDGAVATLSLMLTTHGNETTEKQRHSDKNE